MLESIDRIQANVGQDEVIQDGPFQVFRGSAIHSMETIADDQPNPFHMESWSTPSHNLDCALDDPILPTNTYTTQSSISTPHEAGIHFQEIIDDRLLYEKESSALSSDFPSFIPCLIQPAIFPECATDLKDIDMSTVKLLLNHYQNTLVPRLTPAEVPYKSPWKTLYIPNILSTVGDIVLSGNGTNAKVSLVFATLAISAFNLDGLDRSRSGENAIQTRDWSKLGRVYRERATKRLKSSLVVLSTTQTKKEKYKDILMALLSMITICVSGPESQDQSIQTHRNILIYNLGSERRYEKCGPLFA
jgi:hypothetical protein